MLAKRNLGLVLGIIMILTLSGPMIVTTLLVMGKIDILVALVGAVLLAAVIYLAAQNFLIMWRSSYWTVNEKRPRILGETFMSALAYSVLLVLIGYLFVTLSGGS